MCTRRRITAKNAGYTLLEMIFVIVGMGILLAITVPAFSGFIRSSRVAGETNELLGNLHYARSLAVRERKTFRVEFSADAYEIIESATDTVVRRREMPSGVNCAATADPNFYAWGLADAVTITIDSGSVAKNLALSSNGHVSHY